jgi:hypothetical protein
MVPVVLIGFFSLMNSVSAEEIKIKAVVGENATTFTVKPLKSDYVLRLESNQVSPRQVRIGKKNYEFVLQSSREVIRLAQVANRKGEELVCQRDLSSVNIVGSKGSASGAQLCLLANQPASNELRSLLSVLQMGI